MDRFPAPPYPRAAAKQHAPRARGRRSALVWAAATLAALLASLAGLATLLLIGYGTGPVNFATGLVLAVLPAPIYVTLVLWLDRYEAEPAWMLAASFFWGALVAVFFALIINTLGVEFVSAVLDEGAGRFYGMVVSAPLVEEGVKALALFALFLWKRDEFDGVLDGIIYAAMVGLGFATTENVKYYSEAFVEENALGVFIVRGLFSPFAHPLFTAMTGIGLGLAAQSRGGALKLLAPALGLAAAVALHAGWNAAAFFAITYESGAYVVLTYLLVMVPVFVGLLAVVVAALRREGRLLREHLRCDLERGLLAREEYERLCSLRGRASASLGALAGGEGIKAWRARTRLNRAASELAFLRSRVARGLAPAGGPCAEREAEFVRQIQGLQRELAAGGRR